MSETYNPLLSFIIPVYKKSPETFEKCLNSLLEQTYKNTEILCVFDGPDQELEDIAKRNPSIRRYCIEHGGAPKARNYGFDQSRGDIVSFWDADCFAKPEMAKRWIEEFESKPDCCFVYSGYEFIPEGSGGVNSHEFEPYSLTCQNYIATMFPMKREVFPRFDENLEAAQDWDVWLTISERGGKGAFIQGYGFQTELPTKDSISGRGWNPERRKATIEAIRKKHNIPYRPICISSMLQPIKGLDLAKMLEADYADSPSSFAHSYKMVLNLGFNGDEIHFHNSTPDCIKVQYWLPYDIACLEQIAHQAAKKYIQVANETVTHHLCNEIHSKNRLKDLGIEAKVLPLPTDASDAETKLPDEFKVLIDIDENLFPLLKELPVALPYVKMDFLGKGMAARIEQYSCLVSIHEFPTIDEGIRRFILNGRNIISNVQAPYCGYIDWKVDASDFLRKLIERIREARALPFNEVGKNYYAELVSPAKFKESIYELLAPVLEVVR